MGTQATNVLSFRYSSLALMWILSTLFNSATIQVRPAYKYIVRFELISLHARLWTGYPTFKGKVMNGQELWELMEGLQANDLLEYTHLLTGYIASVSFLETVVKIVKALRERNPELVYSKAPSHFSMHTVSLTLCEAA